MWGTPRDLELITKMDTLFSSLQVFMDDHEMTYAEGFIRGSKQKQNIDCTEYL